MVGQAGSRLRAELAHRSGRDAELSIARAPGAKKVCRHAQGKMLADLPDGTPVI